MRISCLPGPPLTAFNARIAARRTVAATVARVNSRRHGPTYNDLQNNGGGIARESIGENNILKTVQPREILPTCIVQISVRTHDQLAIGRKLDHLYGTQPTVRIMIVGQQ